MPLTSQVSVGQGREPFTNQSAIQFDHFSVEQGFFGWRAYGGVQDSNGYLWIATRYGLFRFDGYTFTNWSSDRADSNSIHTNWMDQGVIALDEEGMIWVGEREGLERFDPITKAIVRFQHDPADSLSISSNLVNAFLHDSAGRYWVGTAKGLDRFDPATGEFVHYSHQPGDTTSIMPGQVNVLLEDSRGNIWLSTEVGVHPSWNGFRSNAGRLSLSRLDVESNRFQHYIYTSEDANKAPEQRVTSLLEDNQGIIWIGTWGEDGLYQYLPEDDTIVHLPYNSENPQQLSAPHQQDGILLNDDPVGTGIRFLQQDKDGYIWIGGFLTGLNRYDPRTGRMLHFEHDPSNKHSLSDDTVRGMLEARDGTKWIFTWNGINRINEQKARFQHYRYDPLETDGLSDGRITSLTIDSQGDMWLGTMWTGLNHIDRNTGKVTHFLHDPENPASISYNFVLAVHESPRDSNFRWVGTLTGLNKLDIRNGEFQNNRNNPTQRSIFTNDLITPILEEEDGRLWIGIWGEGLLFCDIEEDKCTKHRPSIHPDSLGGGLIMYLLKDSNQTLWIGTRDTGLYERRIKADGEPQYVSHLPGNVTVTQLYESPDQTLWVATDNGLYRRTPNREWRRYSENDGLPGNIVCHLFPNGNNELWLSTTRGVSRFDIENEQFKNYVGEEGLEKTHIYTQAAHQDLDGTIYIGGDNGFISFHPDQIKKLENRKRPQVVIDEVVLSDSISLYKGHSLSDVGRTISEVELSSDENQLAFMYTGLHFTNSLKIQYAYQLDGFNTEWVEAGSERVARFDKLIPGSYRFRVKAANPDGYWSEEQIFSFTIVPPWWRTIWAILLYLFIAALCMWLVDRFQRARVISKEREASGLREARLLAEAADERARLAEQLDQVKSRFFVNLSHEFRTPLTLILGPLRDAIDGVHGTFDPEFQQRLQSMRRNGQRLHRLINQLLDLAKLEAGGLHLHARESNLVQFVRTLVLSFSSRAERENKMLQFEAEADSLLVYFDREKMERIVFNLLSNAFKFTPAQGKIRVAVREVSIDEQPHAQIAVKDTGQGISNDELPYIFDRFHQVDTSATRRHEGSGIGLSLAKELVERHSGAIEVASDAGFGSVFTVTLPLGKDHLNEEDILNGEPEPDPLQNDWQLPDLEETPENAVQMEWPNEPLATALIVEDNADVREYIKSHLCDRYRIVEAVDGHEGLTKAREILPDLVISDVMMPKMDGYALCEALKKDARTNDIPVVLLTARAAEENKLEGLQAGADDYIYKPFSARELLTRTENLILLRRRLRTKYSDELVLKPTERAVTSADAAFLEKVRDIVDDRLDDSSFGVEHLSDEVGLSRRQLQRRIRDLTDLTASGLIRMMRIERAAHLLKQKAGNVSEVAYAVGFKDPRHFSRVFRQVYGESPSKWGERNE